jgi:hypothetical protein
MNLVEEANRLHVTMPILKSWIERDGGNLSHARQPVPYSHRDFVITDVNEVSHTIREWATIKTVSPYSIFTRWFHARGKWNSSRIEPSKWTRDDLPTPNHQELALEPKIADEQYDTLSMVLSCLGGAILGHQWGCPYIPTEEELQSMAMIGKLNIYAPAITRLFATFMGGIKH